MSLYKKTVNGLKWSFIGTFGNILIQIISGVVLARLLRPSDFGLYAMVFAVLVISRSVIDSGLYQALIQKKNATLIDFSLVFHFNLFISIFISSLLFVFSSKIESFYDQEGISTFVKFISMLVLIEAFSLIQRASLIKNIRFDTITKIEVTAKLISLITSIFMAYSGFGVWSLLFKDLLFSLLTTLMYWIINPVKILLDVPYKKIKELYSFGIKVFIADQIETISNQFAQIIVGKKFTASDLGFFNKAEELQQLISQVSIVSINKVMFPSFVQIQNDDDKLRNKYRFLVETSMFVLFPLLFLSILTANEMIEIVLGPQWVNSVFYFQLLCISGMFYPFTVYNLNIIKVKGKGALYLKTCTVSKGLLIPIILISINYGVKGLVIGLVFQRLFAALINSYHSGKLVGYSTFSQVKGVSLSFLISFAIFLFMFSFKKYYFNNFSMYFNFFFFSIGFIILYTISTFKFQKEKMGPIIELKKSFFNKNN